MTLLIIHPLLQTLALTLALYAARLGWYRTVALHFGREDKFQRDRHVLVGSLALILMLGGTVGGLIMTARYLHRPLLSGLHGQTAITALPFILFGLFSGFYLYLEPARRRLLPAVHAGNNLLLLLLTLLQIITGIRLLMQLIKP